MFLVEEFFYEKDVLNIQAVEWKNAGTQIPGNVLEQRELDLPEDGQDSHNVRYLPPDGADARVDVYAMQSGVWQKLETKTFGSYLAFHVNGTAAEITVTVRPAVSLAWIGLGAAGLLADGFVVIRIVKRQHGTGTEKVER